MSKLFFQSENMELQSGQSITFVNIKGTINKSTAWQFENKLDEFHSQGIKYLILNFSEVTDMNSAGMEALIKMVDKFGESGGSIKLVSVSDKVANLFKILGVSSFFTIFKTEQEAVKTFFQKPKSCTNKTVNKDGISSDDGKRYLVQFTIPCKHQEDIIRGDSSEVPNLSFPKICACCGLPSEGEIFQKLKAGDTTLKPPLGIPYCNVCLEHVGKRQQELIIAAIIGIATVVVVFIVMILFQAEGQIMKQFGKGVWKEALCACVLGFAVSVIFLKIKTQQFPQTSTCTVALRAYLSVPPSKIFSGTISGETSLEIDFVCANHVFANEFRRINNHCITKEKKGEVSLTKTGRGDLKAKLLTNMK